MKNLVDSLNENIINEAAPKSLVKLRTGNTVYILPKGERKAIAVKITNTAKEMMGRGYPGSYYKTVEFSNNPYMPSYTRAIFGSTNYNDESYQVEIVDYDGKKFYIGTSKEAIDAFTKKTASNRIDGVIERITKLESELAELYKIKAEMEQDLNTEVFESNNIVEAYTINWSGYDVDQEDLDMRCEELGLEYVIIPADKVKYSESVTDWLMEETGTVVKKPFNNYAKSLLKSFGIDPNKVEVFRHLAPDALNNDEIIIYTPTGGPIEGEDYEYAVEELFPEE